MGLFDVINGMQQGPRGSSSSTPQSSGGMSPMTMAIIALIGWKAFKHLTASQPGATAAPPPSGASTGGGAGSALGGGGGLAGGLPGGLGDLLKGPLGGLLGGAAAGSVISGGLG